MKTTQHKNNRELSANVPTSATALQAFKRLEKKDIELYNVGETELTAFVKVRKNYWTDVLTISVIYPLAVLKKSAGTRNMTRELGDEFDAIEAILRDKLPSMLHTDIDSLGEIPQVLADSVYFNNEALIKITL